MIGLDTPVQLAAVEKTFTTSAGAIAVLRSVDLRVARGEVVAIGGRSGSGKTTLLTLIAGFEAPDGGSISVAGRAPGRDALAWSDVAVLPQTLGLLEELTLVENVTLPVRVSGIAPRRDPWELMERLGIEHLADRHPDEVSLGEQQRAALARAAVLEPSVLLADEPMAHQNDDWAAAMLLVLRILTEGGMACVVATHDPLVFDGADRVLELRDGRLHPSPAGG
ncbi:MAG: ATP-binding cassette domain-containing protein [Acidimicrobiales bacterium]